jgi:hypothetical protein
MQMAQLYGSLSHLEIHTMSLTLQQNGILKIQINDFQYYGFFFYGINQTLRDINVDWVLYLDQFTGGLHVRDILNPSNELWNNLNKWTSNNNRTSLTGILVGVIGGVILIFFISMIWLYYAHASEQRFQCFFLPIFGFWMKWINKFNCES